jgi:hypothetical protein
MIYGMSRAALDIQIHRGGSAPLVPYLDKYALPERFGATVTPPEPDLPICHLDIALEDGRPVCVDLRLERKPKGAPLGRALLHRIPITEYVHAAVDHVGQWLVQGPGPVVVNFEGESYPQKSTPVGDSHVAVPIRGVSFTKQHKAASRTPRKAGPVDDETLRKVADTYRTAHARGEPPTRAVMAQWCVSRSTASRWVYRAREAGMLGPAVPRVAGEAPGVTR